MEAPKKNEANGALTFTALPSDLITLLSRYLPLRLQLKMCLACPSVSAAVWKGRHTAAGFASAEALPSALLALSKQPHFLSNIQYFDTSLECLKSAEVVPVALRMGPQARLTFFDVSLHDDAVSLFNALMSSSAPLKFLALHSPTFAYDQVTPITRQRVEMKHLRLVQVSPGPAPASFVSLVAQTFPHLDTLFLPAEEWGALKSLSKLTHLYIQSSKDLTEALFNISTPLATEQSINRLLELNPPKVGCHLLLKFPDGYRTIFQEAISRTVNLRAVRQIVTLGKYRLDFSNFFNPADDNSVCFINYCFWDKDLYEALFFELDLPFHFHIGQPNFGELLAYLFDRPWKRALSLGLDPHELITLPTKNNPTRTSILFTLVNKRLQPEDLEFVRSRPDVFGDIRHLRDPFGTSLVFADTKLIPELIGAGLDWKVVDNFGRNALEFAACFNSSLCVKAIVDLLNDEDFACWCTPLVCGGLGSFAFADRMLALVPQHRWKACIKAALHMALIYGRKPRFIHPNAELCRLAAEAWVEAIDFDFVAQFYDVEEFRGLETIHIAFRADEAYAQDVMDAVASELGPETALAWAGRKDAQGVSHEDSLKLNPVEHS